MERGGRIACLARPQADERDPGADGPHECAEGLTAGAPTSMTCLTTCLTPHHTLTPDSSPRPRARRAREPAAAPASPPRAAPTTA